MHVWKHESEAFCDDLGVLICRSLQDNGVTVDPIKLFMKPPKKPMTSSFIRRPGLTLLELLIVIAIIGILVGLLLPAVQNSRETSRRIQCQNNLKQVGLGLQNYHAAMRSLPPGFTGGFEPQKDEKRWGWATFLLPYIEQQSLYESLAPTNNSLFRTVFDPSRRPLLESSVQVYLCASDTGDILADPRRDFTGPSPPAKKAALAALHLNNIGFSAARANYVGSFGDAWDPTRGLWTEDELRGNGAMGCNSNRKFREITDGLAHTFAVGERDSSRFAAVWAGTEAWSQCHAEGVSMVTATAFYRPSLPPTPFPFTCDGGGASGFGSLHPGGSNFVFCDGSVHFISNSIESHHQENESDGSLGLFQRLARINDGFSVNDL